MIFFGNQAHSQENKIMFVCLNSRPKYMEFVLTCMCECLGRLSTNHKLYLKSHYRGSIDNVPHSIIKTDNRI